MRQNEELQKDFQDVIEWKPLLKAKRNMGMTKFLLNTIIVFTIIVVSACVEIPRKVTTSFPDKVTTES